jgi:aldose 1-epimerase
MSFQVRTEQRPAAGGLDGTVYVLESGAGDVAELWPALGCNCFRWQATWEGRPLELLYATPDLFADPRPTRVGVPVLFPFPNRIRDGRFTWQGKEYRLPPNDPAKKNAIHGFACRRPWRVLDRGTQAEGAWLTAEFSGSKDAPETLDLWPADYRIRLTVRLGSRRLRFEALVDNPAAVPLPFGLGYHPYFRVPLTPGGDAGQCLIEVNADTYWELHENLPTGRRLPADAAHNLTVPRPYPDLQLDDLLRANEPANVSDALRPLGHLRQQPEGVALRVSAGPAFREVVVFTPPHRKAFCLEPYTCLTDALNLQPRGVDAGLHVLGPGACWAGVVEMELRE